KTNYLRRFKLLKSGQPRLVVRRSNRYVLAQIVESKLAQDKVVASASSRELLRKGWPKELAGSLKSRAAAYLTGMLLAKKLENYKQECVVDIGPQRHAPRGRIYACVRGAIDGGLNVSASEEVLPSDELLNQNEKLAKLLAKMKEGLNG
ncbi:50S ribosomal protein L18, partial [Candidatus Pacearchaeota archaeon]